MMSCTPLAHPRYLAWISSSDCARERSFCSSPRAASRLCSDVRTRCFSSAFSRSITARRWPSSVTRSAATSRADSPISRSLWSRSAWICSSSISAASPCMRCSSSTSPSARAPSCAATLASRLCSFDNSCRRRSCSELSPRSRAASESCSSCSRSAASAWPSSPLASTSSCCACTCANSCVSVSRLRVSTPASARACAALTRSCSCSRRRYCSSVSARRTRFSRSNTCCWRSDSSCSACVAASRAASPRASFAVNAPRSACACSLRSVRRASSTRAVIVSSRKRWLAIHRSSPRSSLRYRL